MLKKYLRKNTVLYTILVLSAFTITIFCSVSGNYDSDTNELKVGSVSPKKFVAQEEIKNEVATQRNIDKAISEISPIYTKDSAVQKKVTDEIISFFDYISKNSENIKNRLASNSEKPQIKSPNTSSNENTELSSKIYLSSKQTYYLANMEKNSYNEFKNNVLKISTSALEQGIREDEEDKTLVYIKSKLSELNISSELSDIGYSIISSSLEPNLIIDTTATEKAKEEKIASIEPVMLLKNQKIVDSGEIISEEIYSLLYSSGYIQKDSLSENIPSLTGTLLLILSMFMLTILYIYKFHKKLYKKRNEALLLFSLYSLLTILTKIMSDMPYMFIPILTFTMLAALLLNYRLAIILNFSVCIIYYIAFNLNSSFLIYFSSSGMLVAFTANLMREHNKILKIGILNCFSGAFIITGITLYINKSYSPEIVKNSCFAFLNGIITLILCTGSMPLWESLFKVTTQYKLLELINPDRELLRRLLLECPGTYNHSIIVANLAEAAAFEIGANSALAKVGSYYHDVGKLKYPQYFSENMRGKNPHDSMNPYISAKIISSHVDAGLEYAQKYNLPNDIKSIIAQHHGNTAIRFFYFKAKKQQENGTVDEADFRYKHERPLTKEAAIVMLADTVEAAVRSKNESNLDEIKKFVHELISEKLNDGQFNKCSLKISDLEKIENAFMKVLSGMYHERVAYPDEKENNNSDTLKNNV